MGILDVAGPIIEKVLSFIPDPQMKAKAQLDLFLAQQAGEFKAIDESLQMAQMQNDVNKVEAASPSRFNSGWRPAVGWTCALALFVQFMVAPMATWIAGLMGHPLTFPPLDMGTLLTLLGGLLGLGTLRTAEKIKGVAS